MHGPLNVKDSCTRYAVLHLRLALILQISFLSAVGFGLTFWHRSFTFNSNKSQTWCNNFSVDYPDVCLELNMFRAFSRPSSGAQWLQWQPLVLPSYPDDIRAVFVVGPARPRTQHDSHHDTKVKPEAATAVIELLMMGRTIPETCWVINKCQDNKLQSRIWLVIYFNLNTVCEIVEYFCIALVLCILYFCDLLHILLSLTRYCILRLCTTG
jgi:hypothetical protein